MWDNLPQAWSHVTFVDRIFIFGFLPAAVLTFWLATRSSKGLLPPAVLIAAGSGDGRVGKANWIAAQSFGASGRLELVILTDQLLERARKTQECWTIASRCAV
jgi:hypothetical protein